MKPGDINVKTVSQSVSRESLTTTRYTFVEKKTLLARLHSKYLLEKSAERDAQVANPPDFAAQCSAVAAAGLEKKFHLRISLICGSSTAN